MMTKRDFSLHGRVALVTGASRGIGYYLALELAARGAHIIALARTVSGLTELDNQIQEKGALATLVPLDLHHMENIEALALSIANRWKNWILSLQMQESLEHSHQ